jgi:hypothetical protein
MATLLERELTVYLKERQATIGLSNDGIQDCVARLLSVGVGKDSFDHFAMTSPSYGGQDVTRFIETYIRPRAGHLFSDHSTSPTNASPRPGYHPDGTKMTAIQRLDFANGSASVRLH